MKHVPSALIGLLMASALLMSAAPAIAQVNVDVTLGYPGGYGIAQPSYSAPQPYYIQPQPAYVQRNWYNGHDQWRDRQERQERHEREWQYRHRHEEFHRNDHDDRGRWEQQQDNRGWRDGRGGNEHHQGWQR